LAALRVSCAPPASNLAAARLVVSFPSLSPFRAQNSSRHLTKDLSSVYLPLDWWTPIPSPPITKIHLPVDTLAHLTRLLQKGLTRFPLILHAFFPVGTNIPTLQLVTRTYHPLRVRAKDMMVKDWITDMPTPPYYDHPTRLSTHTFLGLGKFVAWRIHHMRSAKRYLAAHPSWFDENPELTCPQC